MIIPEHKALFIHIPKTAGQSVEDYFLQQLGRARAADNSDYLLEENKALIGPKRLAHLTAQEYVTLGYLEQEQYDSCFRFSFVRNPWARLVSLYKFRGFSSVTSFANFVENYLPYYLEHEYWFFRPQTDFIYDETNQLCCDFVGHMENLQQDFEIVLKQLSLPQGKLEHKNVSVAKWFSRKTAHLYWKHPGLLFQAGSEAPKESYQDYYTPSLIALVHRIYERDIDLLNYQF